MCQETDLGESPCTTEQHIQNHLSLDNINAQVNSNCNLINTHLNNTSTTSVVRNDKE